jgi:hypothetical protein
MKKIVLAVLTTAALGTTLTVPSIANAHKLNLANEHSHHSCRGRGTSYAIYYQRDRFDSWHYYGCYDSRFQANISAFRLRAEGFRVSVEGG